MIDYISKPFKWFFKLEAASGLVLLFDAIISHIIPTINKPGIAIAITSPIISLYKHIAINECSLLS